ncbi:MAG: DNA methyltransferase, partial [Haliea sp.]
FPVELIERLVLSLTNRNDRVFDPYMGAGTTVVGAVKHGRYGWGCDVVPEYVNVAWERLHLLRAGLLRTRPMDRPVYDPKKPNGGQR